MIVLAAAGLALLCFIGVASAGWVATRPQSTLEPTGVPVNFGYCGVELTNLCVISFGRDVFGATVINFYVPQNTYSDFYLHIIRAQEIARYDCKTFKSMPGSVFCTGNPIPLGEGFKIQMLSASEGQVLAQGVFTLNAYIVTTPIVEESMDVINDMPTPTSQPSQSYP